MARARASGADVAVLTLSLSLPFCAKAEIPPANTSRAVDTILRKTSDLMMISFMNCLSHRPGSELSPPVLLNTEDATVLPNAKHETESVSKMGFQTIRM
jgi:hypothetical protein